MQIQHVSCVFMQSRVKTVPSGRNMANPLVKALKGVIYVAFDKRNCDCFLARKVLIECSD